MPTDWLDSKHVVFGSITKGIEVLDLMENVGSRKGDMSSTIHIQNSGQLEFDQEGNCVGPEYVPEVTVLTKEETAASDALKTTGPAAPAEDAHDIYGDDSDSAEPHAVDAVDGAEELGGYLDVAHAAEDSISSSHAANAANADNADSASVKSVKSATSQAPSVKSETPSETSQFVEPSQLAEMAL